MTPGDAEAGEHHLGEVAHRVLGLLGHVDRVLEADHREERERGRRGDREEGALVARGCRRPRPARSRPCPAVDGVEADEDDEQQAGELDQGEHDVGLDALADPAEVDRGHEGHEAQRDDRASRVAVARRRARSRRRRLAAKALEAVEAEVMPEHITVKHDDEGHEVDAERLVRVERRTGRLRVLRHELEVGERRDRWRSTKATRNGAQAAPRPRRPPRRSGRRRRCRGCRRR